MSAFHLLVRAHDHIIADRRFDLKARVSAAAILWRLAIAVAIGQQVELP